MAEVLLRMRVINHADKSPQGFHVWWQRRLEVQVLPGVGDEIQLWGTEDGALSAVRRRWWRTDGVPLLELAEMSVDSTNRVAVPDDPRGGLAWVPWFSSKGDHTALLTSAGWVRLTDD